MNYNIYVYRTFISTCVTGHWVKNSAGLVFFYDHILLRDYLHETKKLVLTDFRYLYLYKHIKSESVMLKKNYDFYIYFNKSAFAYTRLIMRVINQTLGSVS